MSDKAINILNKFNDDGWEEIEPYFGDFTTFYNYMKRNGLSEKLNIKDVPDEYINHLLIAQINDDAEKTLKYICDNVITDVEQRPDGYYLKLRDREELSEFFRGSSRRDYSARDAAKAVLGEDYYEPYWDTTSDVYSDVIEELDKDNLKYLGEYIVKTLEGKTFSTEEYDDEFFNDISDEQGNFTITNENVTSLIGDESAMNQMLKGDLDELKSELHSIHNNAYNSAYTDELWDDVMSELTRYFDGGILDVSTQRGEKTVWEQYIKIRDFQSDILKFLDYNKDSGYNDSTLDYFGSYTTFMEHMMDEDEIEYLDFRVPEYADFTRVRKNINEILGDYI